MIEQLLSHAITAIVSLGIGGAAGSYLKGRIASRKAILLKAWAAEGARIAKMADTEDLEAQIAAVRQAEQHAMQNAAATVAKVFGVPPQS